MKKLLLLIILVIAAAIPAVPYYIGTTVEASFHAEHEEMAKEAALSGFNIELIDYQRELFTATATSRISIIVPDKKETLSFDIHHRIDHTPQPAAQVIATVDSELVLSDEITETLAPLFKGEAPLSVNTRIFLDGHQDATLNSPAASGEFTGKESVMVEWKGMQGTVWQNATRDKVTFNMTLPGMVVSPAKTEPSEDSISISNLQYDGDLYKGESGFWHGKANATIAGINVNVTAKATEALAMQIKTIELKGEQSESNGLVQASGVMTSKSISVNGFEVTNATYDVAIENLDAKAMKAWQQTAQQMMKNNDTISDPIADPLAALSEHLPALFNAHPTIRINDLSVDSPMGRFAFKLNTSIIGEWNDMLMENPAMLATMVKADLNANVPRSVVITALQDQVRAAIITQAAINEVEMTPEEIHNAVEQSVNQQLTGLIAQGFIKENETQLESRVEYEAGKLLVNGLDASPLIGAMMP
jgi:uncharacterized protein YdgA (DUF945 family)